MFITGTTLAMFIATTAAVCIVGTLVGNVVVRDISRRGKAQVFFHDPEVNSWKETWQKLIGNEFLSVKGDAKKRVILEGDARLNTPWGTWIVDPKTGHNFRSEKLAEFIDRNPALHLRLLASNPASYHLQTVVNRQRAALNANQKDDKLEVIKVIAICSMVAIFGVLVVVGFIAWKVSSAASKAGVGGG